jgi:hypothetical protein
MSAADDAKRRAADRAAELAGDAAARPGGRQQAQASPRTSSASSWRSPSSCPRPSMLRPFQIPRSTATPPSAARRRPRPPAGPRARLRGRRRVPVSEVFVDNQPLNRAKFEERASPATSTAQGQGARGPRAAPRPGHAAAPRGRNVFVSRRADAPLPARCCCSLTSLLEQISALSGRFNLPRSSRNIGGGARSTAVVRELGRTLENESAGRIARCQDFNESSRAARRSTRCSRFSQPLSWRCAS